MGEIKENINRWSERITDLELNGWDDFPGIPLYMDQLMSVLAEDLAHFKQTSEDKLLTSTMINNYVKSGVIPHPEHKKYSKEQVAAVSVVAMLKTVLSIQDLKTLLADCPDMKQFYESFCETQQTALKEVCGQLTAATENGDNLKLLALRLSAEAMARRAAAERILQEIGAETRQKPTKTKKK